MRAWEHNGGTQNAANETGTISGTGVDWIDPTYETVGANTDESYYNENWQVLEVRRNGDPDAREQYTWDAGYIDTPIFKAYDAAMDGTVDNYYYYMTDATHNVTSIYDSASGQVQERYLYDPYGRVQFYDRIWTKLSSSAKDNSILYGGYVYDDETHNYYARNRYLQPTMGKWTQRDFAGYVDGANLYGYVRSNPIHLSDASGLDPTLQDKEPGFFTRWKNRIDHMLLRKPMEGAMNFAFDTPGPNAQFDHQGYVAPKDDDATSLDILFEFFHRVGPPVRSFKQTSFMTIVMAESGNVDKYRDEAFRMARSGKEGRIAISSRNSLGAGWGGWPSFPYDVSRGVIAKLSNGKFGNLGYVGSFDGWLDVKIDGNALELKFHLHNDTSDASGHLPLNSHPTKTQYWDWEEVQKCPARIIVDKNRTRTYLATVADFIQ